MKATVRREDDILPYEEMAGLFQTRPKQSFMPPSGREGDREAVEGARGHRSRAKDIATGEYGIRLCGERREEQAPPLPRIGCFHAFGVPVDAGGRPNFRRGGFHIRPQ